MSNSEVSYRVKKEVKILYKSKDPAQGQTCVCVLTFKLYGFYSELFLSADQLKTSLVVINKCCELAAAHIRVKCDLEAVYQPVVRSISFSSLSDTHLLL